MSINAISSSSHFFGEIDYLYLSDIKTPYFNLRNQDTVAIDEMVDSIIQHGLLNPIIVRTKNDNYFEIVAGYRRYLACKSLKWKKIACHIVNLNDMQTFEVSLVENIKRKSLTPVEEANAFKMYVSDKGWGGIAELSIKIGKSSSYITRHIALLDLPNDILEKIRNKKLNPSVAEELLSIKDHDRQSYLGNLIHKRHLTVKRAREMIKEDPLYCENSEIIEIRKDLQIFNKSIIALRVALNRLGEIMEEGEGEGMSEKNKDGNFLIQELIRHHSKCLHSQIDNLLKSKKKYAKNIVRYRKILDK